MSSGRNTQPIGVFDSGIGGISVLGELIKKLPDENYIYLADSANAPYGTKDRDCVRTISVNIAKGLINKGIKALVVACNTATSVAINQIRQSVDIPVIGMEPALKPAVEAAIETGNKGYIVVMATPLTLKEDKFNSLYQKFNTEASILPLPCPGLVELIESEASPEKLCQHLAELFLNIPSSEVSSVVLGCTHYCFVRTEIARTLGDSVTIFDGNEGTVRHLQNTLVSNGILSPRSDDRNETAIEFIATSNPHEMEPLCRRFLDKTLL